eukprot:6202909-Pyramimonas_sp.AAC.1
MASALRLAETWDLTKEQQHKFNSWAAKRMSDIARTCRRGAETMGVFWRRLYRTGHALMEDT